MTLKHKALNSFKWSVLGEVFSKAISPLVFVILAKILLPEDFGVVAAAAIVISFSQVFWDAGLSKALIQKQNQIEESATVIFWVNLALACLFFVFLLFCAESIGRFFNDSRLPNVIRVLGIQLPLAASCSVFSAFQQRDFKFRQLFWVRILTTAVPVIASIPLALYGAGYWALVAGTLVGQLIQAVTLWKITPWHPTLSFDRQLAYELFRFGRWAMFSALLAWFFLWMDALIVGGFLGTHDLGLYRTGNALVTLVFSLVAGPVIPVLYSLLSRVAEDLDKLRAIVLFVEKALMIIVIPCGIGLFVIRDFIPGLIFTDKWQDIGQIIGIVGLTQAISYTVSVKQEVYRSIGRPSVETKIMVISMLIRIPFYLFSIQYGIIAFVWARFASTLLGVINHLYFARKIMQMPYKDYFNSLTRAVAAGAVMFLTGQAGILIWGDKLSLIPGTLSIIGICFISYAGLIYLLESTFIKRVIAVLRGKEMMTVAEDHTP